MSSPQHNSSPPPPSTPTQTKDSPPQDVDMEAPESPPETSRANSSSQFYAPSGTQANTSGRLAGEGHGKTTKPNFGAPGSSWTTKKFNDDYERAELNLLDRGWENKYGKATHDNPQQQ